MDCQYSGVLIEQSSATGRHKAPKAIWICCAIVAALIVVGAIVLAKNWPFTRTAVIEALQQASGRTVQIDRFSDSYFPPGCTAEGIRFLRHNHPDLEPIIKVDRLSIRASLAGLLGTPKRLALVKVVGMHLIVPKSESNPNPVPLNSGRNGKSLVISKIVADGAVLEFVTESPKNPFILKVKRLALTDVGVGTRMSYSLTLQNTEPPGVIQAEGNFGPWNPQDIGSTPVYGSYHYQQIELGSIKGIRGIGDAKGTFSGQLSHIQTKGSVNVARFEIDGTRHEVPVVVTYNATVNGTNGDVLLNPAIARFRHTEIQARGTIAGGDERGGKTASFNVSVPTGRVDDLLYLFSGGQPGMSGNVYVTGTFLWPRGPVKFLEKIRMDLAFGMRGSRFTSESTQNSINRISESAQGEKKKQEESDPRAMLSVVHGDVALRGGVATISNGSFDVTGAQAALHGTYGLIDQRVDLQGTLDTAGHLSDSTSGFKALLVKAVSPLFKKENKEKIVPFRITGRSGNLSVGIDWKTELSRAGK